MCAFPCHTHCKDEAVRQRVCAGHHEKEPGEKQKQDQHEEYVPLDASAMRHEREADLQKILLPCFVCANDEVTYTSHAGIGNTLIAYSGMFPRDRASQFQSLVARLHDKDEGC